MTDTRKRRNGMTYRQAGVNIEAADNPIHRIAPAAAATRRVGAEAELGGFGGLFDLKSTVYRDPILGASTDGVGTKLKLAIEAHDFTTIGRDPVGMCVNDIVFRGQSRCSFSIIMRRGNSPWRTQVWSSKPLHVPVARAGAL